jgi:hypothetical protein
MEVQAGGIVPVVECLPSRNEALGSNPSTAHPPKNGNLIVIKLKIKAVILCLPAISEMMLVICGFFFCRAWTWN